MFCPSWIWRSSAYITICFRFSPSISFKLFLVHLLGVVVKFTLLYNILLTAIKFSRIANLARPSNISNYSDNHTDFKLIFYSLFLPGYVEVEDWIITNKWDYVVANKAVILLQNIHEHRIKFLIGIAGYSGVAIICGILLIVSVSIKCKGESSNKTRRQFMLPWLCFDFLTISIITLTFVTWAFLSFFVHILLAILFPVIAGAILGLYIYLWRNVRDVYEMYGDEQMKTASSGKLIHVNTSSGGIHYSSSKMYRKLPAAASSPHSVNSHPSVLSGNRHIAVTWCNYNKCYVCHFANIWVEEIKRTYELLPWIHWLNILNHSFNQSVIWMNTYDHGTDYYWP